MKKPFSSAFAARRCDSTANWSCCSRVKPYFAAMFSAVTPMWPWPKGSCSAPVIASTAQVSPMRCPQRPVGRKYAARLMLSAPPPTTVSVSPSRMCCAAETIACSPEPHRRLTVRHGVPTGSPASIAATRDRYMSRASPWITLPITTWPTVAGSTLARASASLIAIAPSFVGARSFSAPP